MHAESLEPPGEPEVPREMSEVGREITGLKAAEVELASDEGQEEGPILRIGELMPR